VTEIPAPKPPARPLPVVRVPTLGWLRQLSIPSDLGTRTFALGVIACTAAVSAFLLVQVRAWPPHEDETLALFVGRRPVGDLFSIVLGERGGAPLHFLFAWIVAHTGGGLLSLRLVSVGFAVASVPVIAFLCARLADRLKALLATLVASGSWVLLFHGIYGRMYSLFLFTSALSYLALLYALDRGGRRAWALYAAAILLCVATHPYGAIVLASQGLYVLARRRMREAAPAYAAIAILGIPFWRSDLVLAGRFEVGVGGGGEKLGGPLSVLDYLRHTAGDFTAGYETLLTLTLLTAALGVVSLARSRPRSALLIAAVVLTPTAAFMLARLGRSTAPESRHLIFVLPFFALAVVCGAFAAARPLVGRATPILAAAAVVALLPAEIAWGYHRTAPLFSGEHWVRTETRVAAAEWLAQTARRDDILFGYDPVFLAAWEHSHHFPLTVVPRADARLAVSVLRSRHRPLGRGVWVFDRSDNNNWFKRLYVPLTSPEPKEAFEVRSYGPFLIIRSRRPTGTPEEFLEQSRRVMLVGKDLYIGDADTNYGTVLSALNRLKR
jgi:hypothetical protein